MTGIESALDVPLTGERPRLDATEGQLIAGECGSCGARSWPRRSVCHRCGASAIHEVPLPAHGVSTTWTRVWIPVEGLEPPYSVGLVELGGVQIFGHIRGLREDTKAPADVAVRVNESETPPYWFELL